MQNIFVARPISLGDGSDVVNLDLFATGLRGITSANIVTASIGDVPVSVGYIGAQGTYEGLDQMNLRIPYSLANKGLVNVKVYIDGTVLNTVQIKLQQ